MKVVLIGASGTIGKQVAKRLAEAGHDVVPAGRRSGTHRVDIENRDSIRALFRDLGAFDALAVAAGHVTFKPFAELTAEDFRVSFESKFLGQVGLVQEALPFLRDNGAIVLVSGVTAREPIRDGVAAAAVSRALEGFAMAAAPELPRGIRINVVSPTILEESIEAYKDYFAGHRPVSGRAVADAYLKAITGRMTGATLIP
jgi:NAD(P)-dependent dehydrogenase (short-subunit alcohol dehydrogenase family)